MKATLFSIMFLFLTACSAQIVESNQEASGGEGGDASTSTVSVATVTSTSTGTTGGGEGGEDSIEGPALIIEDRTKPNVVKYGKEKAVFMAFSIQNTTDEWYDITTGLEFALESLTGGRFVGTDGAGFFGNASLTLWRSEPGTSQYIKLDSTLNDPINPTVQRFSAGEVALIKPLENVIVEVMIDLDSSSAELEDEVIGHEYQMSKTAFKDGDILIEGAPLSVEMIDQPAPFMIGAAQTIKM